MSTTISVTFFARSSRANKDGLAPICLRILLDLERFNVTTKIYIDPKHSSNEYGKLKTNTNDAMLTKR